MLKIDGIDVNDVCRKIFYSVKDDIIEFELLYKSIDIGFMLFCNNPCKITFNDKNLKMNNNFDIFAYKYKFYILDKNMIDLDYLKNNSIFTTFRFDKGNLLYNNFLKNQRIIHSINILKCVVIDNIISEIELLKPVSKLTQSLSIITVHGFRIRLEHLSVDLFKLNHCYIILKINNSVLTLLEDVNKHQGIYKINNTYTISENDKKYINLLVSIDDL